MSWRDLVRGVFFRVAAEAWVETDSVGRHQWGWRLRNREGLVIKSLNGRHGDRGAAFDAGVRFFRRHSGATATSGDSEAKVRAPAGATSGRAPGNRGPGRRPAGRLTELPLSDGRRPRFR